MWDANMPTLYTDRLHLYQAFSNLIRNSIKHKHSERAMMSDGALPG